MKIEISTDELGLCIGATEIAIRDLREGDAAATRMGQPLPVSIKPLVLELVALRKKLMKAGNIE